jgi:alkanesulfonate monooxygenase SsuD/methylene tetrahydromethanopterin reductase-like flavin-dependent oxidoreductase (luciferase family)
MSRRLKVAVMLQPGADGTAAGTREQARYAEQLGLDGIFVGDHLKPAGPYPESMVVLAAAAAVTKRIHVGVGVMVLALRDPAWAAKQLATLQHVSGGRVVLGVGTGGVMHGTEAWEAVGVPYAERGRRTDEALALLPGLIRGETVELPSGASITLSPGADVPPILIGGNSPAALRRAVRHGAGWFSSVTTPQRVADGARRLPDTAQIAVGCIALLDADTTDPRSTRSSPRSPTATASRPRRPPTFRSPAHRRRPPSSSRPTPTPARHGSSSPRSATTGTPNGS